MKALIETIAQSVYAPNITSSHPHILMSLWISVRWTNVCRSCLNNKKKRLQGADTFPDCLVALGAKWVIRMHAWRLAWALRPIPRYRGAVGSDVCYPDTCTYLGEQKTVRSSCAFEELALAAGTGILYLLGLHQSIHSKGKSLLQFLYLFFGRHTSQCVDGCRQNLVRMFRLFRDEIGSVLVRLQRTYVTILDMPVYSCRLLFYC